MKHAARAGAYIFSLLLAVVSVLLYIHRQSVIDWWRLRDYEPPTEIVALREGVGFTEEGEKLFYVHYPELRTKENFTGTCSQNEHTIVLGCYISHSKIYVFDVDDERLEGVEEVTAAHEMLHAVYDRLSGTELQRIDDLVMGVYEQITDEHLLATIATYEARDPSIVPNELHSILATEYEELPEELEAHYAKYFSNRQDIVAKASAYADEFRKREAQLEKYDAQLSSLKKQIDQLNSDVAQLSTALNTERQQLEALENNPEQYNAAVPSYNAKVRDYNQTVSTLRTKINQFNDIVEKRNTIALEEQDLFEAIDTRATPEEI